MEFRVLTGFAPILKTLASAFDISSEAVSQAVLRAYGLNEADTFDGVRRVLAKASRGEAVTIAGIGGSITAGSSAKSRPNGGNNAREYTEALGGEKCWFERTVQWLRNEFPDVTVTDVNAGIGATPSFLGAFRLEQMVLAHKPDLVFVEFSVNDPSTTHTLLEGEILDAYEAVVRRCLERDIPVVQVFMNDQGNNGMQSVHNEIARYYQLPTVSYHNAIYPEDQLICDWERLSPDDIHPNNAGHALLGTCIGNLFSQIWETVDVSAAYELPPVPERWLHRDTFRNVWMKYAWQLRDQAQGAIRFCTDTPDCVKWKGTLVSEGEGTVTVTVPKGARRVFVLFFNGRGSFETEMTGQRSVCDTAPTGWPKPMWHRVHTGAPLDADTRLLIRSHKTGSAIILGVLASF